MDYYKLPGFANLYLAFGAISFPKLEILYDFMTASSEAYAAPSDVALACAALRTGVFCL